MATDITLTASVRKNLLSLQNTTALLDSTSERLSTGKKVNSALDNPSSFFTARGLNNRANDLSGRKDGIGQAISLLEATDKSISALTSLVEQAKSVAQSAEEAATGGTSKVSSAVFDADGFDTLSSAATFTSSGQTVIAATGLTGGETFEIVIDGGSTHTITIASATTVADLVSDITDTDSNVTATFNATTGAIDITAIDGLQFEVREGNDDAAAELDFGSFGAAGVFNRTFGPEGSDANNIFQTALATNDTFLISVAGGQTETITLESGETATTLAAKIAALDSNLSATFNSTTSTIDITGTDGLQLEVFDGTGTPLADFLSLNGTAGDIDVTFGPLGSAAEVSALSDDFASVLAQIDTLLADATYKGKNLLSGGDSLDVKFNEDGTSLLTLTGVDYSSSGTDDLFSSTSYDFTAANGITNALNDTAAAIDTLRQQSATFGTSLGIIQTREEFTTNLVNALEEGAGKLVNANLEEESANLLALQTRQALGVQSLSIANQSQQSVLALFR